MAKVIFVDDVEAISGKLSKTGTAMYCYSPKTGKCYRSKYNKNRKESNTELQQEVKTTFTSKAKAAAAWWNINKPASKDATPTAEWTAMRKAFDAQRKYNNPYMLVRARVKDDFTVTFLSGTTTNPPSSGGGGTPSANPDDDSLEM